MPRTIPLTRGYVTIVDDEDFEWLSKWNWTAIANDKGCLYAVRGYHRGSIQYRIRIHRLLLGISDPGIQGDHINGDTLDNRKANLRICTSRQNSQNRRAKTGTSSQYKGVGLHKPSGKWTARIMYDGVAISLGAHITEEEAAVAYDNKARELFGAFARLNFPNPS